MRDIKYDAREIGPYLPILGQQKESKLGMAYASDHLGVVRVPYFI